MSETNYSITRETSLSLLGKTILIVPNTKNITNTRLLPAGALAYEVVTSTLYVSSGLAWLPISSGAGYVLPAPLQSIADLTTLGNEIL